jgi:hypothetical protein
VSIRQVAHLVREKPPLVISPDARNVVFTKERNRFFDVPGPVDDIADGYDDFHGLSGEFSKGNGEAGVFSVNIAEKADSFHSSAATSAI